LDVVAVDGKPDRLSPPPHLNKAERTLFAEIVGAVDPRHFVEGDLPLLCSYVTATLIARKASHARSTSGKRRRGCRQCSLRGCG
jgi:hypothetical protein